MVYATIMNMFGDPLKDSGFNAGSFTNPMAEVAKMPAATTRKPLFDKEKLKNYQSLGETLVVAHLITKDQLEIAKKVQREGAEGKDVGNILVELGFITESTLAEILVRESGLSNYVPGETLVDSELVISVPKDIAVQYRSVPISREGDSIIVAMVDTYDVLALDKIRSFFPKKDRIVPLLARQSDLMDLIERSYSYNLSVDAILKEIELLGKDELSKKVTDETYVNPTVRLLDSFMNDAIRQGASDIHLEPEGLFVRVRYRIDGELILIRSFHIDYWSAIVVRIKIISMMNIAETRLPQDGRISLKVLGREIDFRVSTQPTIDGENVVMRILDKKKSLLTMDQLGFSPANQAKVNKALKKPEGIIIVTGPTGSGKTTTLYSLLSTVNDLSVNIMTLEDPVEYRLPMLRQSNIRHGSGMDFSGGIKSALRQDPDIIFVGEVRDKDTATLAMRASMTGHQVFTSLHTNDSIGAISRLMDIGVHERIIAENVVASIAQRLIRKLCDHCKVFNILDGDECKILNADINNPPTVYEKGAGCDKCNNRGYKGRLAVSEVFLVDKHLSEMIANNATKHQLSDYAIAKGMFTPMADDGIEKVLAGTTDLTELMNNVDLTDRF
jgi:type IV pilus assembly protein PilB